MYIKKTYGLSKIDSCPFCGQRAVAENNQGIAVCIKHKKSALTDLKCLCGGWIDIKKGKYGAFGLCMSCGPMNIKKVLEINPKALEIKKDPGPVKVRYYTKPFISTNKSQPKHITVRSDELDFLY